MNSLLKREGGKMDHEKRGHIVLIINLIQLVQCLSLFDLGLH